MELLEPWMVVAAVLAAALAAGLTYLATRRVSAHKGAHRLFGVPSTMKLLSADLGPGNQRKRIYADGLVGVPDALFGNKRVIVVGEFKGRACRGKVRKSERYQVILYCGMMASQYPNHRVYGVLRYTDRYVKIPYRSDEYQWLLSLRTPCLQAKARLAS
ncbi:MAG: hypothetical protein RJQ08_10645 [Salinisphaeraceae bacterium]